jgi:hypothetical protein
MKKVKDIKAELFAKCENYVNDKISSAQEAIDNAQKSANTETKSSAGDKYETGRSMMQLEILKYSAQLNEGYNLKKILNKIDYSKTYKKIQTGSLVKTNNGIFFIAISAGKFILDKKEYMTISFSSPLSQELHNKQVNDKVNFRNKEYLIKSVI